MNWLLAKVLVLSLGVFFLSSSGVVRAEEKEIVFFYGQGCPHCAVVEEYFEEEDILEKYPVVVKEIYFNRDNTVDFNQTMMTLGVPEDERGVPTVIIGSKILMGDKPIINEFEIAAQEYLGGEIVASPTPVPQEVATDLTWLMVAGAAMVDAINPCAFAVLIILLTTVLMSGSANKALKSGLAFAGAIFISYFLMGLGLYHAIGAVGMTGTIMKVVGILAIVLGLLNLKDYFWYGKGMLMEVPMAWRPKMKSLIGSVTSPVGAFLIGFVVSLFLLPCTSGPYIVILGMLAEKHQQAQAIVYLLVYNLIFVLPMLIITLLVYKGLDPKKVETIRQKRLKTLHLIAGIVLIAMGLGLLFGWV